MRKSGELKKKNVVSNRRNSKKLSVRKIKKRDDDAEKKRDVKKDLKDSVKRSKRELSKESSSKNESFC